MVEVCFRAPFCHLDHKRSVLIPLQGVWNLYVEAPLCDTSPKSSRALAMYLTMASALLLSERHVEQSDFAEEKSGRLFFELAHVMFSRRRDECR